jgi:hypothetical protein
MLASSSRHANESEKIAVDFRALDPNCLEVFEEEDIVEDPIEITE